MLKRSPLVVLALLVIGGTVWWLDKSPAPEKSSPVKTSSSGEKAASSSPVEITATESTSDDVLPSPRHATGEIERHQQARAAMVELEKAVAQQQEKVEEHRKALAAIARTKGVIYKGTDSKFEQSDENSESQEAADDAQSINQIFTLLKYPDEQILPYAAGLDIPNNAIKDLYPQFLQAKRDLEVLTVAGSRTDAASLSAQISRVNTIKSQLDAELVGFRKTMGGILETTQAKVAQRGNDGQAYVEAKRNFETDQALLDVMNTKLAAEKERVKNSER